MVIVKRKNRYLQNYSKDLRHFMWTPDIHDAWPVNEETAEKIVAKVEGAYVISSENMHIDRYLIEVRTVNEPARVYGYVIPNRQRKDRLSYTLSKEYAHQYTSRELAENALAGWDSILRSNDKIGRVVLF